MEKKKIFVCDDDRGILDALEIILALTDASVVSESRSSFALRRMLDEKPHILIVDLWMPELGGDKLIEHVRNTAELRDMYIICMSAAQGAKEIAIRAGADKFLAKPFDMNDILSLVEV
ncbi:response regulator [Sphingobacterium suaedae]|uniref:Response regulator n=1 Tax=Sphingobacterium suaedae TaxID=1686402 RepID=A0ABW5KIF3_9SPHI